MNPFCSTWEMFCFFITNFVPKSDLFEAFFKKKKTLIPHDGWHLKSVAMAVVSRFKSPHCLQSNKKKSVEPSLCPRCCQKQQVARILRFSRSPNPCWISPVSPSAGQRRSCCFPPLQIRLEGHCEMSALFHKALIHTGQHPAIIQSRCHLSVSCLIKICLVFCSRFQG